MAISQTKFERMFSGMTSVAQKVYDCVPISESWSVSKIRAEAHRNHTVLDHRVMFGCLSALRDCGLVDEPVRGEFRRHPVRVPPKEIAIPVFTSPHYTKTEDPTKETTMVKEVTITKKAVAAAAAPSPLDALGDLARRASILSEMVKTLADDIGDAAVEVQAQFEANAEESKKLHQLKALLGSIGGA